MPITTSAKKALRGSIIKKAVNDRIKKALKETVKDIEKLVKAKKKAPAFYTIFQYGKQELSF